MVFMVLSGCWVLWLVCSLDDSGENVRGGKRDEKDCDVGRFARFNILVGGYAPA